MQMIDAGDWCGEFIKTIQAQMFYKVEHINALWVPAQWSNTTFHKLFATFLHGPRTWSMQMIDAGDWCGRFIKAIQVQVFYEVEHMNALWVPTQTSQSMFHMFFAMLLHGSRMWSMQMIDAGDWCR